MNKLVLAGDIGGTKTLLQLAEVDGGGSPRAIVERRFDSRAHGDFNAVVGEFLRAAQGAPAKPIAAACFGVAGPIQEGRARITNLTWSIDAAALGAEFGIPAVHLINDFAAVGFGIEALPPQDLATLQAGAADACGTRAVIGAGTGLGEGILVWERGHYRALPSEGGHVDFAPRDDEQIGLLRYLQARFGHVSYERIVSGSGLETIYQYVVDAALEAPTKALVVALRDAADRAAVISGYAMDGRDPAAGRALDMFVSIYGAQAGNLALTLLATGGVYVAGGIAPKIAAHLARGGFVRAFCDKGRFSDLMRNMPLHVVMNPNVGLIGAVQVASRM